MKAPKEPRPTRGFAVVDASGYIWTSTLAGTARVARRLWCDNTNQTWEQWREERPGLRVIRVMVTPDV